MLITHVCVLVDVVELNIEGDVLCEVGVPKVDNVVDVVEFNIEGDVLCEGGVPKVDNFVDVEVVNVVDGMRQEHPELNFETDALHGVRKVGNAVDDV